ncbi:MAG: DUF2325 domain-containing protein [Gemmatimonadota bacterium]|nr:DUF2325 domain-containing protein [Gemmatimonadota bacterium]
MCKYCESASGGRHVIERHENAKAASPLREGPAYHPAPAGNSRPGHVRSQTRRRKIWELDPDIHCAVIGTCAPVSELCRIYRKVNGSPADAISDYQIHNLFVRSAAGEHDGIKQLQRYLDTRYRSTIRRFGKVKDAQALGELWRFSVDSGEVAAGYWALTTHPMITDSLNAEAFGEVHMLSHLAGRTWQQESSRRKEAESRLQEKLQKLRQVESALNQARKHLDRQTTSVGRMEMKIIQQEETISRLESRVQSLIKPRESETQEKTIATLRAKIRKLERAAEAGNYDNQHQAPQTGFGMPPTPEDLVQENRSLEAQLANLLGSWRATEREKSPGNPVNLNGHCILYVGGKGRVRCQFRRLVELLNGKFLYHDGGREDNHHRLPALVSRADIVLCPISCVSHSAANEVRRICHYQTKPAVWLQAPSLSAFNAALAEIAHSDSPGPHSH